MNTAVKMYLFTLNQIVRWNLTMEFPLNLFGKIIYIKTQLPDNLIFVAKMSCRVQPDPTSEIHSSFCHVS